MKLDPNAPAFPNILDAQQDGGHTNFEGPRGLTIRAEIASRVLAGLLGDSERYWENDVFAARAVLLADSLIAELNKD